MYVLTANYLAFYALAEEIGLSGSQVSSFLSGQETFYSRTDEELWRLAGLARSLGVESALLSGSPADMRSRIAALPQGAAWLASFDQFLSVYGQRLEETCRIDIPSWAEDPSPALYSIGAFLSKPAGFDFHGARAAAIAERDAQVEAARRTVNGGDLTRFNEALASNLTANFAWWNEEHNYLIDRRAAIPVRRATLELGARLASSGEIADPTDLFFAFKPELFDVMSGGGSASWVELRAMIPDRRAYFEYWRERGPSLPPMLGTIPDVVPDPIMIEVFGLSGRFLETMRGDTAAGADAASGDGTAATVTEIRGFPAAKGVAEGVARVITTVGDLHLVEPGEILVCGGTTTEWTPAFGIITACVCDTGGSLTHAAIVSREYGIPCVVGTAIATQVVKTGDRVRVDGRAGTVQVLA
jgi:pyruvate,water dikinase